MNNCSQLLEHETVCVHIMISGLEAVDVMSVPWSGMGLENTFSSFKMLQNLIKIYWSKELTIVLIDPYKMSHQHHGCSSWSYLCCPYLSSVSWGAAARGQHWYSSNLLAGRLWEAPFVKPRQNRHAAAFKFSCLRSYLQHLCNHGSKFMEFFRQKNGNVLSIRGR